MENAEDIKQMVKDKYAEIARNADKKKPSGCCGTTNDLKILSFSCCGESAGKDYSVFNDDYTKLEGYVEDADLQLGCGLPTEIAGIKAGDTVLDLGSGAGNDVFIARAVTGETGRVIGLDMTPEMIEKAERNKNRLGFKNVEFYLGEIENMPLEDSIAEVVISNCVLNLVPDKNRAFGEIFRVLKKGGHFCISDIVVKGDLPEKLKESAAMYAGCISGALQEEEYLSVIKASGFSSVEVKKSRKIQLPDEILRAYLEEDEIKKFRSGLFGIFSITVTGTKQ